MVPFDVGLGLLAVCWCLLFVGRAVTVVLLLLLLYVKMAFHNSIVSVASIFAVSKLRRSHLRMETE